MAFEGIEFSPIAPKFATLATRAKATPVFVEVKEQAIEAEVVRAGIAVPSVVVDANLVASILDAMAPVPTKVVSQSVPPGTAVPRGTAVNLVLARPDEVPAKILPKIHEGLKALSLGAIGSQFVEAQPAVKDILTRKQNAAALTAAEQEQITTVLAGHGIEITEQPGHDLDAAFKGLQAGFLFQG